MTSLINAGGEEPTIDDLRWEAGSGRVLNNTIPGIPTVLGYMGRITDTEYAWVSLVSGHAQAGTVHGTPALGLDELLQTWKDQHPDEDVREWDRVLNGRAA
jgi:hypothetical protein